MTKTVPYLSMKRVKCIIILLLVSMATGVSYSIWCSYLKDQDRLANSEMFPAVYQFEAGNYDNALHGEEAYAGFLDITQKYKHSKTRNLAHFYAGICYLQQANYEQAICYFEQFKTGDSILKARAASLIGDAYLEQGDHKQALKYYRQATEGNHNAEYAPIYWTKAARVYELQEDYEEALKCYKMITQYHYQSSYYPDLKKHINRVQEKIQHVEQGKTTDKKIH